MKKLAISAFALALATPAVAQVLIVEPTTPVRPYVVAPDTTGSVRPLSPEIPGTGTGAGPDRVSGNPAADGNAEQTNKPVPNYGGTSEGPAALRQ